MTWGLWTKKISCSTDYISLIHSRNFIYFCLCFEQFTWFSLYLVNQAIIYPSYDYESANIQSFSRENKNRNNLLHTIISQQWKSEWYCSIWMNDIRKRKKVLSNNHRWADRRGFFSIASAKESESCSRSFFFRCHLL